MAGKQTVKYHHVAPPPVSTLPWLNSSATSLDVRVNRADDASSSSVPVLPLPDAPALELNASLDADDRDDARNPWVAVMRQPTGSSTRPTRSDAKSLGKRSRRRGAEFDVDRLQAQIRGRYKWVEPCLLRLQELIQIYLEIGSGDVRVEFEFNGQWNAEGRRNTLCLDDEGDMFFELTTKQGECLAISDIFNPKSTEDQVKVAAMMMKHFPDVYHAMSIESIIRSNMNTAGDDSLFSSTTRPTSI